jgi:hypothetical protein
MNRERFVKPKIDKYIQLYSKKAKVEEAVQTISLLATIDIENGGQQYPSNQTATISAPASGTQPLVALTMANGVITGATLSSYSTAVYNVPPVITLTPLPSVSTSVRSVEIVNAGEDYTTAPTLKFSYPPTARRAILTGTLVNGSLSSIIIVDGGLGYVSAPSVIVQGSPPEGDDINAVVSLTLTSGVITGYTITSGGNYDSTSCIIFVGEPNTSDIATATCTINTEGKINSITITNAGLNYTTAPQISVSGLGVASLSAYLKQGFGGNLSLNYQYNPTIAYKYYWELDTPLELNENGLLQLVHREFYNVPTNDKGKLIVIRIHDISTKSIVNTKNTGINADFNSGIIIDIGKEDRLLPNEILLEINPQTIDRITLSLNHDISGFAGFHYQIEFLLILKVIEKEPSYLEYGTLNNII